MSIAVDKSALLVELRRLLEADLEVMTTSQREMQAGATHAEAKAEGDKDMRATETSYVARGLAKRVLELRAAVGQLGGLQNRSFGPDSRIGLTALVQVEDEEGDALLYYLAPVGGGRAVELEARKVSVVTPSSPLGRALIGCRLDDEVELQSPQGPRFLTVTALR